MIVLFIKVVVLASKQGRVITMANRGLELEFRWKRYEAVKTVQSFVDLGFLDPLETGIKKFKKYELNFDVMVDSIDKIYDFSIIKDEAERSELRAKMLSDLKSKLNSVYISGSFVNKMKKPFYEMD